MASELNFFDTYVLMAITEEIVPQQTFFKDRYFPTGEGDIFACDKVLTEYRKGDRKMAAFVSARAGDIPMDRRGYEIHEYQPAFIAPSRLLTLDELRKRGFGEAIYANSTPAQRAARLQLGDLTDMDRRIVRREEWMCAQTMINNACTMQTYIDDKTEGEKLYVKFFDDASDHTYTVATKWNATGGDFFGDVKAMCRKLSKRGLRAVDLVLGSDAADAILDMEKVQKLLDRNSGIIIGTIDQELSRYDGVVYMGTLNFGGFKLNLISVDETYIDDSGAEQKYFPATSAMVTAPGCGHLMYGQITQIDYGSTEFPRSEVLSEPGGGHPQAASGRASAGCSSQLLPVHLRGRSCVLTRRGKETAMTKIEIICGTYGYRPDGSKHPIPIDRGGICEVSEEEAQRLFALCVARPAEETPSPAVATPPAGEDGSGAGADPSNSGEGAEGAESAHLDPEQLKTLTNAKLTELAKEMGIDTAKLKTKAQLIAAITDVPLEDAIAEDDDGVDDGEAPPVLTPEAPVV